MMERITGHLKAIRNKLLLVQKAYDEAMRPEVRGDPVRERLLLAGAARWCEEVQAIAGILAEAIEEHRSAIRD